MAYDPYTPGSDARAWASALRQAELAHYATLNWWERRMLWLVLRSKRLKTVLQAGFEAGVLYRFADIQDGRIDEEGTPTPREQKWEP